jgi:hypothetical protein
MSLLKKLLIIALFFAQVFAFAQNYSTINANRPYTLRALDYAPLLNRYHDITAGGAPQTFFYPQIDSAYRPQNSRAGISANPILAFDARGGKQLGDTIMSYEGGLFLSGYIDSLEFWLDARIFSEKHSQTDSPQSWDREFLETQGNKPEQGSGALKEISYSSYARYRGHFALRMGFANLDFARDVQHWGPGYYSNLTLNQAAVPYNQIALSTKIGPLSVLSLYADLDAGDQSMRKSASRNLYGHRYELELGSLTLGLSEIAIVYDLNHHWLFVPIVPLFAEKGNYSEDNNNGAMSFDFSFRFPIGVRIYSEFLLDDMESPTSLIRNDNIEAKWAWMAGVEYAGAFGAWKAGSLAEYARIEPYVYTHFIPNTAQMAHLGYPIGNQAGPNSQTISWLVYAKRAKHFQAQLKQEWFWKGNDGSDLNSQTPTVDHHSTAKHFLDGAKMQYSLTPAISYMSNHYAISVEYTLFDRNAFCSRLMLLW